MSPLSLFLSLYRSRLQKIRLSLRCCSTVLCIAVVVLSIVASVITHQQAREFPQYYYPESIYDPFYATAAFGIATILWDVSELGIAHKRQHSPGIPDWIQVLVEAGLVVAFSVLVAEGFFPIYLEVVAVLTTILRGVLLIGGCANTVERMIEQRVQRAVDNIREAEHVGNSQLRSSESGQRLTSFENTSKSHRDQEPEHAAKVIEADFERERNMKFPVELSASLWDQESRSKFPARNVTAKQEPNTNNQSP